MGGSSYTKHEMKEKCDDGDSLLMITKPLRVIVALSSDRHLTMTTSEWGFSKLTHFLPRLLLSLIRIILLEAFALLHLKKMQFFLFIC